MNMTDIIQMATPLIASLGMWAGFSALKTIISLKERIENLESERDAR